MQEYIAFDSHKRYTLAERDPVVRGRPRQQRIEHRRGAIREYLGGCAAGGAVAVEATGNWHWIVEEIEQAGHTPLLVHPRKAKLMMGLYRRLKERRGHPKAIGAVARHLSEATWHMLTNEEPYRDPALGQTRKA